MTPQEFYRASALKEDKENLEKMLDILNARHGYRCFTLQSTRRFLAAKVPDRLLGQLRELVEEAITLAEKEFESL